MLSIVPEVDFSKLKFLNKNILLKLESSRLYYRELQQSDAEAMFAMESIPEVHQYLYDEIATDIQETHDVIAYIRSQYAEEGIGRMATFLKAPMSSLAGPALSWKAVLTAISSFMM